VFLFFNAFIALGSNFDMLTAKLSDQTVQTKDLYGTRSPRPLNRNCGLCTVLVPRIIWFYCTLIDCMCCAGLWSDQWVF